MHQLITPGVNKYTPTFKTVLCFISKNNLKQLQEFVVKYDKYPIYKELIAFV
jgi:hypothetical protein